MKKTKSARLILPLAAGLLVLPLASCVTIEQAPEEQSSSTAPSIIATVTPSPKDADGTATPSGNVPKETAGGDSFQQSFETILKHATKTKCTGSDTIAENGKTLFLIGDCRDVTITGTGNMIVSNHMKSLDISGTGNIVAVKSVRDVKVSGMGNTVAWRSDDTQVSDTGENNTLGEGSLQGVPLTF
ncbi:DUF3060 domain-containing protein [Glutamicibacter sp.]|uniref:DUF3060 domain-containing protein n=1 Tax=Glutamicibacter sp. TaxID=1931995 RepID=UPI0028BEA928|nr:DUF3060 domain-containing protein [Glutamicibacter sp.]